MRKILLTIIPSVFVAAAAFGSITNITLGIKLGSGDNGDPVLSATDVAGAPPFPQANWNNASGNMGTLTGLVEDNGGTAVATTAQVDWTCPNTWNSTSRGESNNGFPPGPDRILMDGYLDTGNASTTMVTISGIPPEFAVAGFDVYVYLLGGVASGRGGGYSVVDGLANVLAGPLLGDCPSIPSTYVEESAVDHTATGGFMAFGSFTSATISTLASTANCP